jgi:uncharacterized membrane protein (UPF0127 family)
MNLFITQMPRWLIKNLLLFAILMSFGCRSGAQSVFKLQKGQLATQSGELIHVELAVTYAQQSKGLSGRAAQSLKSNEGMLFVYSTDKKRSFWMPDTYFNLDIIFLDAGLNIVNIHKNVKAHPGRAEPPAITRTAAIYSRYVLELDAQSEIAKKLKLGDKLKWLGKKTLFEIKSKIRP